MMTDIQTGESPLVGGSADATYSNTHVQDGRSENYDLPYVASGATARKPRVTSEPQHEEPTPAKSQSASSRYNIRRWATYAHQTACELQSAAAEQDFMEATSAGVELTDALSQLWRLRAARETFFAEVVNMLQLTVAKVAFETLSPEQCGALVEIIDKSLLAGSLDESDVRQARSAIRRMGFDAYRGLTVREDG